MSVSFAVLDVWLVHSHPLWWPVCMLKNTKETHKNIGKPHHWIIVGFYLQCRVASRR